MAIHIQQSKSFDRKNRKECTKIESIPCKIMADCDAQVTNFFGSTVKPQPDDTLTASFRGYPLKGKEVKLPEGYVGVVLHESVPPMCEGEERKFHMIHKFQSFRYWNWDVKPSKNDKLVQALDWVDIAQALHSPITDE